MVGLWFVIEQSTTIICQTIVGRRCSGILHRKIDQATRDTVRYLRENNVSLSKVHCILGSYHGSVDKLPFTKSSLRTVCKQVASDQKDDDIKKTMDLFRSMHASDPDFAFRFELDDDGRIRNLIWTTGRSRRQYTCFGDVVVFHTTKSARDILGPFAFVETDVESVSLPKPFCHNILYVSALELVKMGNAGEDRFRTVMKHITACKKELRETEAEAAPMYYSSECEGDAATHRQVDKPSRLPGLAESGPITSDGVVIKAPVVQKSRGRPKTTRLKSFMDTGAKKKGKKPKLANRPEGLSKQTSFCKLCKLPGHNSSTCSLNPGYEGENDEDQAPKKSRRKSRCRNCQSLGHNSATCTKDVA